MPRANKPPRGTDMGNDSIIAFKYAIADGLRWLFVRHGKWRGWKCPREECGDLQMEFELLTG